MTYNVFGGTLNLAPSVLSKFLHILHVFVIVLLTGVVRSYHQGEGMPGRQTSVEQDVPDLPGRTHGEVDD